MRLAVQSPIIPPQNFVFFIMLTFLVHKILTFYLNVVLKLYVQLQSQRVKNRGVRCWTVDGNRSRIGKRENICAELKFVVLSRNYKPTLQFFFYWKYRRKEWALGRNTYNGFPTHILLFMMMNVPRSLHYFPYLVVM